MKEEAIVWGTKNVGNAQVVVRCCCSRTVLCLYFEHGGAVSRLHERMLKHRADEELINSHARVLRHLMHIAVDNAPGVVKSRKYTALKSHNA